jgi:hypothetical protein
MGRQLTKIERKGKKKTKYSGQSVAKRKRKQKIILTLGEIRRWRWELLARPFSVIDHPSHLQAPAGVYFQMTVHEPDSCSSKNQQVRHVIFFLIYLNIEIWTLLCI